VDEIQAPRESERKGPRAATDAQSCTVANHHGDDMIRHFKSDFGRKALETMQLDRSVVMTVARTGGLLEIIDNLMDRVRMLEAREGTDRQ
jgi:hypothetical protein